MKLNFYSAKDYENQGRLRTPGKQTQLNPISKGIPYCSAAIVTRELHESKAKRE